MLKENTINNYLHILDLFISFVSAAFPFALKSGLPVLPSQYGYPQYVYPSTYVAAPGGVLAVPHSPLSPTTSQYAVDYSSAYAQQFAASGYEAYPYTSAAANGYVPAAYTYAMPQPIAAGAGHYYQAQQIQERMQ
ncbi:hypothetical protein SNE40_021796 [Patella caerulea]|uniref:Uncharacterized protein n=1 Tax=Patella caerulea TaxID=87958 RepID=A0AAN8IX66_PATCE